MDCTKIPPCVLVIFGGTGDLTHRKLIPALYNLKYQNWLPENFAVVSIGRRNKTDDEYRKEAWDSVGKYSRFELNEKMWGEISNNLYYKKVDFEDGKDYEALKVFLKGIESDKGTEGNIIFYLAVAPEFFETIITNLHENGMVNADGPSWQRVVIEKPFGSSLKSARDLNRKIAQVFNEKNTFRIDHYLGKEMVQSIMNVRFANSLFEPLWNNKYIDNIQISSCETIGIENRGEYYEKAGALGDMIQNHMLQILALVAMEPPAGTSAESIRDEKVKVLGSIKEFTPEVVAGDIVFGQYSEGETEAGTVVGYRQENKVSPDSKTESYAAIKIQIDNPRWEGVPFYIRTGKRLAEKTTDIVVQLKMPANAVNMEESSGYEPNLIVIRIQPKEELFIRFNTKKPGILGQICPVKMNYCQKCRTCELQTNSPEAYEKLIYDVINGDSTLFTRWDEVEKSWSIIETIKDSKGSKALSFPNYKPGTWGPDEADELLKRDGRHWWNTVTKGS
ncbi:MAG: glucose-6-phosphate dehydrogenase [Bacillota bacterium]